MMNIAYCTNRDYLYPTMISMFSLLLRGREGRGVRIMIMADRTVTKEDLEPLYRLVSHFPGCVLDVRWPHTMFAGRFVSDADCYIGPEAVQVACRTFCERERAT